MDFEEVGVPFTYFGGKYCFAEFHSESEFEHYFGGELDLQVKGANPEFIRRLITLDLQDPLLNMQSKKIEKLPVLYPFVLESGEIRYKVIDSTCVEILNIEGKYDPNWPYSNYPSYFSKKRFGMGGGNDLTRPEFECRVAQGISGHSKWNSLIAVIPPSDEYGCNLWFDEEDLCEIHVKSFFDPETGICEVYNEVA